MKQNNNIEKILLNDIEYDKIIKAQIEKEFHQELIQKNNIKDKTINNIIDAPKDKLFTKFATYEILNKNSKSKSYINGIQAEGFLGAQNIIREKLLKGEIDSFTTNSLFIKFISVNV